MEAFSLPSPESNSPSSDSSCESEKRPREEGTEGVGERFFYSAALGSLGSYMPQEPRQNSSTATTSVDQQGKGHRVHGSESPKKWVKGQCGTCQQVTEAPHSRLQLGRGGWMPSHVLLVAEAQEPQLLHPALATDSPTGRQQGWQRRPAS